MRDDEPFETDQSAELSNELNKFGRQLNAFQPSPSSLDREQLMFEAGRAAALAEFNRTDSPQVAAPKTQPASMRVLRLWQTAALLMTSVSLSLATSLVLRDRPEPQMILAERSVPGPQPTVAVNNAQLVRAQPTPAEKSTAEKTAAVKTAVNGAGTNSSVVNSVSVDAWSLTISQGPSSQAQMALEFALANGLSQRDNSGRTKVSDGPNRSVVPNEPALSPLSLRGDSSRPLIHRLVEEHAL